MGDQAQSRPTLHYCSQEFVELLLVSSKSPNRAWVNSKRSLKNPEGALLNSVNFLEFWQTFRRFDWVHHVRQSFFSFKRASMYKHSTTSRNIFLKPVEVLGVLIGSNELSCWTHRNSMNSVELAKRLLQFVAVRCSSRKSVSFVWSLSRSDWQSLFFEIYNLITQYFGFLDDEVT